MAQEPSVQQESKRKEAYGSMRYKIGGVYSTALNYPIELLMEWDDTRMKLNPHAPLSYAQKLLSKSAPQQ